MPMDIPLLLLLLLLLRLVLPLANLPLALAGLLLLLLPLVLVKLLLLLLPLLLFFICTVADLPARLKDLPDWLLLLTVLVSTGTTETRSKDGKGVAAGLVP